VIYLTAGAGAAVNSGPPLEVISMLAALLLAVAGAWREWSNRRKLKAEAKSLDLKTPAEVDNLNATTHTAEFNRVLAFNEQLIKSNTDLVKINADQRVEMDTMGKKLDEVLAYQRKQDAHSARLEQWLEQAYTYIEDLLAWVDRHVPGAVPPVPPRSYRPRFAREDRDATEQENETRRIP
jgi:hypothetical protein